MTTLKIMKLDPKAVLPRYETDGASGMDLTANEETTILPGRSVLIGTGLALAIPEGYEAQIRPRSGIAARHGLTVLNAPGTIDADYRGEIKVLLVNHSSASFDVFPGLRVAQLVVCPVTRVDVVEVEALDGTARGAGGFGSTGS